MITFTPFLLIVLAKALFTPAVSVNDIHDVNSKDDDGLTELHYAALRISPQEIQALLKEGANPRAGTEKDFYMPCASLNWSEAVVKKFSGSTPLHFVASCLRSDLQFDRDPRTPVQFNTDRLLCIDLLCGFAETT